MFVTRLKLPILQERFSAILEVKFTTLILNLRTFSTLKMAHSIFKNLSYVQLKVMQWLLVGDDAKQCKNCQYIWCFLQ